MSGRTTPPGANPLAAPGTGKALSLALILAAQVAAMSVWFSSSAAIAGIKQHYTIGASQEALLTTAVQIGFVAGTIVSALLSLADRMTAQRALAALGFDPGAPDGIVGAGTRTQLRAWQKARGLTADGYLSPAMVERLRAEAGGA